MVKKRVTIKDVAVEAGVSRQTVSRAINNQGEISPTTKERVLQAIEKLGYQPNRLAQGMVTQRTKTVALLVSDIANPFFPEVARGVQDCAREQGYNVFLCNTDGTAEEELETMQLLASQRVDGMISFASKISDADLQHFAHYYHPIVIINRVIEHPHINLLLVDNGLGAQQATAHLVEAGHKKIGMLTNESHSLSKTVRVQGFQDYLTKQKLSSNMIVQDNPTIDGGQAGCMHLLERWPDITAVFAYNDLMAIGALQACRVLEKRVPEDIAIIGFDDIQLASVVTPSLSSVHVNKYSIGQMAMQRIFTMLDSPEKEFETMHLMPELVLRESTNLVRSA